MLSSFHPCKCSSTCIAKNKILTDVLYLKQHKLVHQNSEIAVKLQCIFSVTDDILQWTWVTPQIYHILSCHGGALAAHCQLLVVKSAERTSSYVLLL